MNRWIKLGLITFVLIFTPTLAFAEQPSIKDWAQKIVTEGLLQPLARKESERSKFSRSRQVTRERRLEVLGSRLSKDHKGQSFVAFKVDARFGDDWETDIVGCVYRETAQIFVQRGDEYRAAGFLLGKNEKPVKGVCRAVEDDKRS